MTEPDTLFHVDAPPRAPNISAGRRITLRQKADVEAGRHPLMTGPLRVPAGETCGSCLHRVIPGSYPKCDLTSMSHSAGTDCRAWWPACPRWETTQ